MIEAILFDKDGTLFDFRKSWSGWADRLIADLSQQGAEARDLARVMGYLPEAHDFRPDSFVIAGTSAEVAEALAPLVPGLDRQALVAHINAVAATTEMVPAVPLRETLEGLRDAGLRLGLATNDAETPARMHLEAHGIDDLFDFIAGFDSGHGAKPGAGMVTAFLSATGVGAREAVMVGDSRHDLIAGRAAGVRTVAVLTGIAGAEDLAPLADVVLPDIGHLKGWIATLG